MTKTRFLKLTYLIHAERERMFFDALDKTNRGAVVCVFDITDRLQHMFFRHLDDAHPANRGRDTTTHRNAIRQLYQDMDDLVGRTIDRLDDDTVLMVMSDHGFKPFRRGVNLNSWLYRHGFLALKNGGPTGADYFRDVDWSKSKAYAVGFGGIYINQVGREAHGTVAPGEETDQVKREISEGLRQLYDDKEETHPVRAVYDSSEAYFRAVRWRSAGPHCRVQTRSPRRLVVSDRERQRARDRGQRPTVERRPQLQPAGRPGYAVCQPKDRRHEPEHHGHRPDGARPVWRAGPALLRW